MNIIDRIRNRLEKNYIDNKRRGFPFQKNLTYVETGNQWYDPIIGSPEIFINDCTSAETINAVNNIIQKLSSDDYLTFLSKFYSKGINNFKKDWSYADILTVLYSISSKIDVEEYLEIGGLVVFDDIDNPNHRSLKKLWYKTFTNSSRYSTFEFEGIGLGVGFAIKLY